MQFRILQTLKTSGIIAVFLMMSTTAQAVGSDEPPGPLELFFQLFNFAILIGVIIYFARKPVQAYLGERRGQIQGDLESAASLLTAAEERHEEIQRKLNELQSEIEALQEVARQRAEEESERILAEAQRSADRIHSDASAAIEQELARAQRELRSEAAGLAVDMAAEILSQQVGEPDRERLLDEFIERVEDGTDALTHETNS